MPPEPEPVAAGQSTPPQRTVDPPPRRTPDRTQARHVSFGQGSVQQPQSSAESSEPPPREPTAREPSAAASTRTAAAPQLGGAMATSAEAAPWGLTTHGHVSAQIGDAGYHDPGVSAHLHVGYDRGAHGAGAAPQGAGDAAPAPLLGHSGLGAPPHSSGHTTATSGATLANTFRTPAAGRASTEWTYSTHEDDDRWSSRHRTETQEGSTEVTHGYSPYTDEVIPPRSAIHSQSSLLPPAPRPRGGSMGRELQFGQQDVSAGGHGFDGLHSALRSDASPPTVAQRRWTPPRDRAGSAAARPPDRPSEYRPVLMTPPPGATPLTPALVAKPPSALNLWTEVQPPSSPLDLLDCTIDHAVASFPAFARLFKASPPHLQQRYKELWRARDDRLRKRLNTLIQEGYFDEVARRGSQFGVHTPAGGGAVSTPPNQSFGGASQTPSAFSGMEQQQTLPAPSPHRSNPDSPPEIINSRIFQQPGVVCQAQKSPTRDDTAQTAPSRYNTSPVAAGLVGLVPVPHARGAERPAAAAPAADGAGSASSSRRPSPELRPSGTPPTSPGLPPPPLSQNSRGSLAPAAPQLLGVEPHSAPAGGRTSPPPSPRGLVSVVVDVPPANGPDSGMPTSSGSSQFAIPSMSARDARPPVSVEMSHPARDGLLCPDSSFMRAGIPSATESSQDVNASTSSKKACASQNMNATNKSGMTLPAAPIIERRANPPSPIVSPRAAAQRRGSSPKFCMSMTSQGTESRCNTDVEGGILPAYLEDTPVKGADDITHIQQHLQAIVEQKRVLQERLGQEQLRQRQFEQELEARCTELYAARREVDELRRCVAHHAGLDPASARGRGYSTEELIHALDGRPPPPARPPRGAPAPVLPQARGGADVAAAELARSEAELRCRNGELRAELRRLQRAASEQPPARADPPRRARADPPPPAAPQCDPRPRAASSGASSGGGRAPRPLRRPAAG